MNHSSDYAYGLWPLVFINSAIFIIFAFSFTKPKTKRDWRSFGALSAFIIALFTEMYGFPLTIYLLSGWLQSKFPDLNLFGHNAGHLWYDLLGFEGDAHFNPIHIAANIMLIGGFMLLTSAWSVLLKAQKTKTLAITGPYKYIRHPQYTAFFIIMLAFLLMWPTILTLIMFPVLVFMYYKLAKKEESEVTTELGEVYSLYAALTPAFFPNIGKLIHPSSSTAGVERK